VALALLLAAAFLAALARRVGDRDARHWAALAAVLSLLSVDEAASLHERLGGPAAEVLGDALGGALHFAWVVPGVVLALVVGLAFLRFVLRLPPSTRRLVVAAAEEGLEMAGSVLLLYAALRLLRPRPEPDGGYHLSITRHVAHRLPGAPFSPR
jgi:hypothetical protein